NKVPGLVLPGILFLGELFVLPNVAAVAFFGRGNACGGLFERHPARVPHAAADHRADGGIFLCRRGMNRKKQIEKMNIQDL
ncbi:hypothetical protein DXB94_14115, partial [Butyricicoccus sp. OM06-6AC]